jgi:hypothetical protein
VCILGYLFYLVKKNGLRATAIQLIVSAEKALGSGQGKEKMDMVIDGITNVLPIPLRMLITKSAIESFVQHIFDEVKQALDYREE